MPPLPSSAEGVSGLDVPSLPLACLTVCGAGTVVGLLQAAMWLCHGDPCLQKNGSAPVDRHQSFGSR